MVPQHQSVERSCGFWLQDSDECTLERIHHLPYGGDPGRASRHRAQQSRLTKDSTCLAIRTRWTWLSRTWPWPSLRCPGRHRLYLRPHRLPGKHIEIKPDIRISMDHSSANRSARLRVSGSSERERPATQSVELKPYIWPSSAAMSAGRRLALMQVHLRCAGRRPARECG